MYGKLVSIIIPVFNAEKYLEECLISVRNQTYENLEIIIVNDGSTDSSNDIIKKYHNLDNRIIVVNQSNSGLPKARNTGILKSTGDYIFFLDADDIIDKQTINVLVQTQIKFSADIVICSYYLYKNGQDISLGEYSHKATQIDSQKEMLQLNIFSSLYACDDLKSKKYSCGTAWGKLYSHCFVKDNALLFDERLIGACEDNLFNLFAYELANKIVWIDYPFLHYRVGINSVRFRYIPERFRTYELFIEEYDKFVSKNKKDLRFQETQVIIRANSLCVLIFNHVFVGSLMEIRQRLYYLRNDIHYKLLFDNVHKVRKLKKLFVLLVKYRIWILVYLAVVIYKMKGRVRCQ